MRQFGAKLIATDALVGQTVIGGRFVAADGKRFAFSKLDYISVGNDIVADADQIHGNVIHYRYQRLRPLDRKYFAAGNVLVDSTVPGLLYNPQSESNVDKKFTGDMLLMDDPSSYSLYDPADLAKLDSFLVYFNLKNFTDLVKANQLKKLSETHHLNFVPAPVLCLLGVYLIGWSRAAHGEVDVSIRSLGFPALKNSVLAHLVSKAVLLIDHYGHIPAEPYQIIRDVENFLDDFPVALAYIRGNVGDVKSYKEYIKRTKENADVDLTDSMDYRAKCDSYVTRAEDILQAGVDQADIDEW